jgi:hypothetical protein
MTRGFVVVGQSDYLDPAYRPVELGVDSRARAARRDLSAGSWRSVMGAALRSPTRTPRYVEFGLVAVPAVFGLVKEGGETASLTTYTGAVSGGVALYTGDQTIYASGAAVQAGLAQPVAGDSVGLLMWEDANGSSWGRYLLNGRRNVLGYTEALDNAAWTKASGATASGQYVTFTNASSYVQQNVASCGTVGAQVTFSALVTSSNTTTLTVYLMDSDGAPTASQAFALTASTPTRITFSQTMAAGYAGTLSLLLAGAGVIAAGTVIRFEQLQVNAGLERDPYQKRTDAAGGYLGHPFALTAARYRMGVSLFHASAEAVTRPDLDDQLFPQADCQPWGAVARVTADQGGNSPAASLYTDTTGATALDAYKRRHATTGGAFGNAFSFTRSRAGATALVYAEWLCDQVDSNDTEIGLATTAQATYIGSTATSWGYGKGGAYYTNGALVASNAAWAYGAGDYPGVIYQPSTGKGWYTKAGVPLSGNPEAGTGAHFTTTGTPYLGSSIWQNGSVCLKTHAAEQRYRPSYCEAWDGADLLPDLHFRGTLKAAPKYRRGLSAWPWNRRRSGGSPISDLELLNRGGRYDVLELADLRDERVVGYWLESSAAVPARQFYTRADRVEVKGDDAARVLLRDRSALLDVHLEAAACLFGFVRVPGAVMTGARDFVFSHHPYTAFTVKDGGSTVTNWVRLPITYGTGFRRTVAPTKKTIAYQPVAYELTTQLTLPGGGTFTSWTGDNPDGWTPTETAPSNIVTQSSGRCRFVRANPGSTVKIAGAITGTPGAMNFLKLTVSSYVSGAIDVVLYANGILKYNETISAGDGEYWIPMAQTGGAAPWTLEILAAAGTDLCIDNLELWTATAINSPYATIIGAAEQLLEGAAGFSASDWTYDDHGGAAWYSAPAGYWSGDRPLLREALEALCDGALADWWVDADDVLHLTQLPVPSASLSAFSLGENDILELDAEDDTAPGLTDHLQIDAVAVHSETEIDGTHYTTDPALAAYLRKPATDYRAGDYGSTGLDPFYSHAIGGKPKLLTITYGGAPAITPLLNFEEHWAVRRRLYRAVVKREAIEGKQPGECGTVTWPRHGLSQGKPLAVVDIEDSFTGPTAAVLLWG